MEYTRPLARLIEHFQRLPGVGPKSAQRMAFHILRQDPDNIEAFSKALIEARDQIGYCQVCCNLSAESPCELCRQHHRHHETICVVTDPKDLFALERTHEYQGAYHVLHGLISPMDGIGPEDLKIQALIQRLGGEQPVSEIILALPPTIEGDTTSLYLVKLLRPLGVPITRIAFGLPAGGELEFADSLTLTRALQGRQAV